MESDDDYGLYEATDSGNVSPEEDDSDEMVSSFLNARIISIVTYLHKYYIKNFSLCMLSFI